MKKSTSILAILFFSLFIKAQNIPNPYASISKKAPKMATVTNGAFDEFFIKDSLVLINGDAINRKTGELVYSKEDNSNEIKQLQKQQDDKFRFLSVDPLTKGYPMLTPYQYAGNSPISGIDIDGLEYFYAADGSLIGKYGTSTEVYKVNDDYVKTASNLLVALHSADYEKQYGKVAVSLLFKNSSSAGMNNDELNTRAFMSTIKQTENGGNDALGYNSKHGFEGGKVKTFTDNSYEDAPDDYADHPYQGQKGASAAGAYQILRKTYNDYTDAYEGLGDFSPQSQDKIVLAIFDYAKATENIKNGELEIASQKLTKKPAVQFASLPGGGQEGKITNSNVRTLFKQNVSNELSGKSNIALKKGTTLNSVPVKKK